MFNVFFTTSYQHNRTCAMPLLPLLQVHLLLQDNGHNYVFTANRLDNSDFNIADLFL